MRAPLPIDPHLPAIVDALRAKGALVLIAEPGAGKTTRVPRALFDAGLAEKGEIVVLEPRRLAARLAARRVASELGEEAGGTVGYQVRFEDVSSKRTRIRFVTEGILTRRLADDPELRGVAVLVLDELHERHLHSDLALAFARRLREGPRQDLAILAMSATLDAEPVAAFLGCDVTRVPGRAFPVAIEHAETNDDRPLEQRVVAGVRSLLARGALGPSGEHAHGDALVFLPGAAEIQRARGALEELAAARGLEIALLHGDLDAAAQDRAVRPGPRPKVILSTNVAESSVTIEGVAAVVDSGLARVARHSPWSGLPTLEVAKVSRASATQRAGRAGRTRPGLALRLYTKHDHDARPGAEIPEIRRVDLAETVLLLRSLGEDPAELAFFERPDPASLAAADALLARLRLVDADCRITADGRRARGWPIHPRLGRLVLAAVERGAGSQGCLLAALLAERDIRRSTRARLGHDGPRGTDEVGSSDLLARRDAFEAAEHDGLGASAFRAHDLDGGAALAVARLRDRLVRDAVRSRDQDHLAGDAEEEALLAATLAAFPDRVGKRRERSSDAIVFAGGGSARLAPTSVVKEAELLVACEVDDRRSGGATIRVASTVLPEMLLELFPDDIRETDTLVFDPSRERIERVRSLAYEGIVLDESRGPAEPGPETARLLADAVRARGIGSIVDPSAWDALSRRLAFAAKHEPTIAPLDEARLHALLVALCADASSLHDLRAANVVDLAMAELPPGAHAQLSRLAPERVSLPGRPSGVEVHYELDRPPWIESRLQDFFGLADGPRVANGKEPLVLHLLAPNGRAVQVTTDLAGFWDRHYPAQKRELGRRYPRHHWPDDPRTAVPRKPRPRSR